MKLVGLISTAVLSLTLGVAAPVYAQQEQRDQQEERKPSLPRKKRKRNQAAKQEEKAAEQQEKNTKPEERTQSKKTRMPSRQRRTRNSRQQQSTRRNNGGGRIPDDRFKAHFGQGHTFRVSQGDYRNHRFQYGGYSFGFVDPWPSNWLYTQNVYVIEINGVYYLCNSSFPGVNLALSFTL